MAGEQRFVMSARIIGAVHRDSPKLKMFMISVLWSDETDVIVYRSFKEFKKLHMQLKKRFPHMNPLTKDDRVIPKFKGKIISKGSKRSVQRMKFLESYCDELLKCDQTVTQSSVVFQFFMPKDHDLQPDFTKNRYVVFSVFRSSHHAGSVTHPFVTQTVRCVAAYETKDTKNRPFKVSVDEKLDVLIKDPTGWWLVENEDKRLAWFPAPYLELWEGEDDEDDDDAGFKSYSTKKDDEVSVPIGSVVEVLRKSDNGWWLIRFNGKSGYIPSMNLKPYNNPRAGLYSLQRKLNSSTLNLATSREPQAPRPISSNKENSPRRDSEDQTKGEPSVPGRLQKAQSLDVLSENWSQTPSESEASTSNGRTRSMSNTSTESSFSDFSSISESLSPTGSPIASFQPGFSDNGSTSFSSKGSETASIAPRVPPRPKTEEILTRCTTMTRKAALATKTRLQIQPELIHSR
uniref:NADPH oxidase organizer 1b n=1 Tax=Cyclopterus lumpus TaxID=8103 RepID=A0A8C2WXV7_CYCLU